MTEPWLAGSLYTDQARVVTNSHRSTCLCLLSAGNEEGMCYHTWLFVCLFLFVSNFIIGRYVGTSVMASYGGQRTTYRRVVPSFHHMGHWNQTQVTLYSEPSPQPCFYFIFETVAHAGLELYIGLASLKLLIFLSLPLCSTRIPDAHSRACFLKCWRWKPGFILLC